MLSRLAREIIIVALANAKIGKEVADAIDHLGTAKINAEDVSYDPSNAILWQTPTPENVYEALEQLAIRSNVQETIGFDTGEPNGFINRTDSSISFDASNPLLPTFIISPVGSSYSIYVASKKITINAIKSAVIPNVSGTYFFYIDGNGNLDYSTTFNVNFLSSLAYVAYVYWDALAGKTVIFADERHGIVMDGATHAYRHSTYGAAFDRGCGLENFVVDGSGNSNSHAQFTAVSGIIWDEDIKINLPAQTQFPVLYRSGTDGWKKKNADSFPIIYSGNEGYLGTRIAYNRFDGTSWSLSEVDSNKFVIIHVFATNDVNNPYLCVLGQNQYNSKTEARDAAVNEIRNIAVLPVAEFVCVGSVIFQTSESYTNIPKAKIVSINSSNYADHRFENIRPGVLTLS